MLLAMSPSITSCSYTGTRKSQAASPLALVFFASFGLLALGATFGRTTGLSSRVSTCCCPSSSGSLSTGSGLPGDGSPKSCPTSSSWSASPGGGGNVIGVTSVTSVIK